jgi:Mor family transcriptional regulator
MNNRGGRRKMEENESELFNEVYKEICEAIGLDGAIAVYQLYKGQQITFPIHLFNARRIQHSIIKEYDGSNIRELAKKYGYSEKTVRRMIKDSLEEYD